MSQQPTAVPARERNIIANNPIFISSEFIMADLRVVQFSDPHELLKVLKDYDDSSMNLVIGPLLESVDEEHIRIQNNAGASKKMFTVFSGNIPW